MTDGVVETGVRVPGKTPWVRRAVGVVVLVVALLATWWVVSARGTVEATAAQVTGGFAGQCTGPDGEPRAVYGIDQNALAEHTVTNPSPWAVEVISTDPEVYRFSPLAESSTSDLFVPGPSPAELTDRVVVPPGREVSLWIADPFPRDVRDAVSDDSPVSFDGVDVQVRSLGLTHDERIDLGTTLWLTAHQGSTPEFADDLAELCR